MPSRKISGVSTVVSGGKKHVQPNINHEFNSRHVFEQFVREPFWVRTFFLDGSLFFRRHSPYRPYVANMRHRAYSQGNGYVTYRDAWGTMWEHGTSPVSGQSFVEVGESSADMSRHVRVSSNETVLPAAIGSICAAQSASVAGSLPKTPGIDASHWGSESLTETDVPGTQIGNLHRHPLGRSAWFNEVGQVPLSQGSINLSGTYNPAEERLHHSGFQVYYANSGGTGTDVGAVKANGELFPAATNNYTFRDATFNSFSGADVGRYIAIPGRGIYLITAFISSSTVETDAATINEPFTNQTGITWYLRTGPIGEYFFRRRPYFFNDSWASYVYPLLTEAWSTAADESLIASGSEWNIGHCRPVYDGYGHWWWTRYSASPTNGLCRKLNMSQQPIQDMLGTAAMTLGSNWLTGGHFLDIARDKDKMMWVCGDALNNSDYVLALFDPAPAGDATTPTLVSRWRKQQTAADAAGLTSRAISRIVVDRSGVYSGGANTQRIWVGGFEAGVGSESVGGISYTDDEGATWSRLHVLSAATGTASVTNGLASVTGSGTAFDTEFAVGDWVRFASDTRSYRISAIGGATSLTLAENYAGSTNASASIQKGALASNEAVLRGSGTYENNNGGNQNRSEISSMDYDSQGNLFWVSSSGRICRFKQSDGAVVSFAETAIPSMGGISAISSGTITCLRVSRIPDVAGVGTHPFHDDIWLGCRAASNGTTDNGWIRVIGSTFTSSPTSANFTRYHYNTSDSFPSTVDVPSDGPSSYTVNTSIIIEPVTGSIILFSTYTGNTEARLGWHILNMTGSSYWKPAQSHVYPGNAGFGIASSVKSPYGRSSFDGDGMGLCCTTSDHLAGDTDTESEPPFALNSTVFIDRRWNGTQWLPGLLVGSVFSDANFRQNVGINGGNNLGRNAALGAGLRRVHDWYEYLEDGVSITFEQAGGGTAQTDEFIEDESTTFVCFVGTGKDNTQSIDIAYDAFMGPTAYRVNDEPDKTCENLWTSDGGVDGGMVFSVSGSLTSFLPKFDRGISDITNVDKGNGTNSPYTVNMQTANVSVSAGLQMSACLRIPDEGEFTADGSVSSGLDTFTTAGAHTFVVGDVGKSIFIEGANGATPDVNNGQAVILAYISPTQVQTDKVFSSTLSSLRWKLRDVPAVSFVEVCFLGQTYNVSVYPRHDLWSSSDLGENWVSVKYSGNGTNSIPSNGPDDVSSNVFYSSHNSWRSRSRTDPNSLLAGASPSVIYDLRQMPENTRRRMYWRHRTYAPTQSYNMGSIVGLILRDDNFVPIGRPTSCRIEDVSDPVYFGNVGIRAQINVKNGTGASPVDDGNGDGLTNLVNVSGSLYNNTGSNNASVTAPGRFIAPSSIFTRLSIGKFVRIENAANAANDGFALITGYVSGTEVQTSKSFTAEANTFDWQVLDIGPGDELRIDNANRVSHLANQLDDSYFLIDDVPSNTQIKLVNASVPHPLSSSNWYVSRELPFSYSWDGSIGCMKSLHPSQIANFDSLGYVYLDRQSGTIQYSENLEFVVVQSSTVSASSPADDDGDARTDRITVAENLVSVDGPVAGDYLEINNSTYGRRVFEIAAITGADPTKTIRVTYDEISTSASDWSWRILRRRNLSIGIPRLVVAGAGSPPA